MAKRQGGGVKEDDIWIKVRAFRGSKVSSSEQVPCVPRGEGDDVVDPPRFRCATSGVTKGNASSMLSQVEVLL